MAKRGGSARGPLVKNAGWTDLFNPLTRISLRGPAAGRAGPLTRKKEKLALNSSMAT